MIAINRLIPILAFLLISFSSNGQNYTINGVVLSTDKSPVVGASIVIKGELTGTQTNSEGRFSIQAAKGQVLEFSSVGYLNQQFTVKDQSSIRITLTRLAQSMEDIVVVGYGTQKKANLTGAVTTVDTKVFESRPISDVARALQGVAPGLTITTSTGALGTDPKIRLRGMLGSINTGAAGAKPLILVDNVEVQSLQMINPEDIESVSVLKDAASTSIYGTRAAWGVILINTKSGKKNTPYRVSYSNNFAWAKPTTSPKTMDPVDQAITSLSAVQRFSPSQNSYLLIGVTVDTSSIRKMKEWKTLYGGEKLSDEMVLGRDFEIRNRNLYFYRPWDAQKKFFRNSAPQQNHNLTFSGGNDKTSYSLGLGLLSQQGVLKANPDEFNRYNLTLGVNSSVNSWLDIRTKILFARTLNKTPFIYQTQQFDPLYYLYRWTATYPYGTYEGKPFRSAFTEVNQAKMNEDVNTLSRISVAGILKILPGLTAEVDYTFSSTEEHLHQTGGSVSAYDFWSFNGVNLKYGPYTNSIYNYVRYYSNWNPINTGRAYATYLKDFDNHSFKFLAGSDIEMYKINNQSSQRNNLLDPNAGEISLATGNQFVDGNAGHWSTLGFFGRVNYSFKQKFLFEANARFDGSSRFPVDHLWGFFPSMSAGYILTDEPFMKFSNKFLDFFKIRGSYGSIGNQAVGDNRFLATMNSLSSGWLLPGVIATTMSTPQALSPLLTWEKVRTLDFGVDARFLQGKLVLSFDWYQRTTLNMIGPGATLPASFGSTPPVINFGELRGRGYELAIEYNHAFNNGIKLNIGATLADGREEITKFSNKTRLIPNPISEFNNSYYQGMYIGDIWGYETDRLFQAGDFSGVDANGKYIYKAGVPTQSKLESGSFFFGPGDVKYKDLNGDGIIYNGSNTVGDPGDMKIIGNSTPRYNYGMKLGIDWKGFDFGVYFQGVGKRQLWGAGKFVFPGTDNSLFGAAWFDYQKDYWTSENTNAFYPRATNNASNWNYLPQTRYMLNMAYLRMKNLTIGYTLPKDVSDKIHIYKCRIYFSGENILTFHHLGKIALDPEMDYTSAQITSGSVAGFGAVYPYRSTVSFGIQFTF